MKLLALLFLPLSAFAADITSTRVSAYDFQTQDAAGAKISDHQRFDTALVACLNTPTCVFVAGGKYRITRGTTPPPPPPPPPATGTAALTCTTPTKNTDGTNITQPVTYKIYHGTSPTALNEVVPLATCAYTFTALPSGTHYFAATAIAGGIESSQIGPVSKVIP